MATLDLVKQEVKTETIACVSCKKENEIGSLCCMHCGNVLPGVTELPLREHVVGGVDRLYNVFDGPLTRNNGGDFAGWIACRSRRCPYGFTPPYSEVCAFCGTTISCATSILPLPEMSDSREVTPPRGTNVHALVRNLDDDEIDMLRDMGLNEREIAELTGSRPEVEFFDSYPPKGWGSVPSVTEVLGSAAEVQFDTPNPDDPKMNATAILGSPYKDHLESQEPVPLVPDVSPPDPPPAIESPVPPSKPSAILSAVLKDLFPQRDPNQTYTDMGATAFPVRQQFLEDIEPPTDVLVEEGPGDIDIVELGKGPGTLAEKMQILKHGLSRSVSSLEIGESSGDQSTIIVDQSLVSDSSGERNDRFGATAVDRWQKPSSRAEVSFFDRAFKSPWFWLFLALFSVFVVPHVIIWLKS